MKDNKVLTVIYGIALFAALTGIVSLLYNGIEMLSYTSYYKNDYVNWNTVYQPTENYIDFQRPIAIAFLVASIFGFFGVCAGVSYLFVKKPLFKIICISCIAVAVVAILAALIVVCSVWNTYYTKNCERFNGYYPHFISSSSELVAIFAVYSASLSSAIQNFVCFTVILAVIVFEFVKSVKEKKKQTVTQEVVVEEISE